jgi:hypothetical protein
MKSAPLTLLLLLSLLCPAVALAQVEGASSLVHPDQPPTQTSHENVTQSDAERIRALEARVAQLEHTVDALLKLQNAATPDALAALPPDSASSAPISPASASETTPAPPLHSDPILIAKARSQELLPSLGKIGAVAFLDAGSNSGPFTLNRGSYFGGGLSLPLAIVPGGRMNYEVSIGLAQNSRQIPITSSVAQLINLTVLDTLYPNGGTANIQQAFTGTGSAPFAVTVPANWRAQTLQIVPLAVRYDLTHWDRLHFRPYLATGLGAYVTISNQVTTGGIRQNANLPPNVLALLQSLFGNNSPLSGALLGGQIATASELKASGIPAGEGGLDVGMLFGGGIEWRPTGAFSVAIDNRYHYAPSGTSYNLTLSRIGWHF